VIVPTRDRPRALQRCLAALESQSYADLEVIVVDDRSALDGEVAEIVAAHPRARSVRGRGSGPAAARNIGARAAQGAFLCFTDDDCEPEQEWVEHLVGRLRDGADAVAGKTLSGGGALAAASEVTAHAPAGVPPPAGSDLAFAPTNNLACTRLAFEATPFDESFPHAAGEDRDWCARLTAAGYILRLEPRARLVHRQELTFSSFLRQQARYGEGAFRFRRRGETTRPFEGAGFYGALLRRGLAEGPVAALLVCAAQVATGVGFVRAWARDVVSRGRITARRRPAAPADGE
jgi:glycosyltransferase involved in cell wall biosynthesis